MQKYCFFGKKQSQKVKKDSQIVQLYRFGGISVLSGGHTGLLLEDTVEGLVGSKTAADNGIDDGSLVAAVGGVTQNKLCVRHPLAGYVLGERDR